MWYAYVWIVIFIYISKSLDLEKQEKTPNNKGIVFASVMKEREKVKKKKSVKRANEGTNTQYMEFGTNISVLAKQFQQCVRQRVIIG